ncbi:MAG: TlpA disulfide reductase family protein [Bacteroidota bacterium]
MNTHKIAFINNWVKSSCFLILSISLIIVSSSVFGANKRTNLNTVKSYSFEELAPRLNQQTDSLYVINFWATWCAPCVKEIPDFEKIQAEYADQKVKVLFVSLDSPDHLNSRLIPFIEKMNMKAEVVMLDEVDGNKWIPKVDDKWSGAIPATLIYNSDKREFYAREFTYEELQQTLESFLNTK